MKILVTGGAGYIGSHVSIALLKAGHSVIIADNLSNSKRKTVDNIMEISGQEVTFYEVDVTDAQDVEFIFKNSELDVIVHLAGLKAVGDSVLEPQDYYFNNLVSTIVLVKACLKYDVNKFVFSSSATVYGNNSNAPFIESMDLLPTTNPYGETKVMSERILTDVVKANSTFSVSILRYFNPVGAHESGLIGETPNGTPNNLMPYITQVAKGKLKSLTIFGNDYPTEDGTGVRDYIHVMDLAEGHLVAVHNLTEGIHTYNLGTGKGTSVLSLLNAFEVANRIKIPYEVSERRPGDIASSYADVSKAKIELGWTSKRDIFSMCQDAWRFEKDFNG